MKSIKTSIILILLFVVGITFFIGYDAIGSSKFDQYRPKLLMSLPFYCNQPDGMTFAPESKDIYLSCPNFTEPSYPGMIVKVSTDNELSFFCTVPVHPETKRSGPMGLDFGPDGNIYYADNQYFYDTDYKSRLMRINIKNGKPVSIEPVVTGFKLANAVVWKDDAVYVSDTFFDISDKPGMSGIYRIKLNEMQNEPVKLKPKGEQDVHLLATFQTMPNKREDFAGVDGITFDSEGNLYTGNFGDGTLLKVSFDENGKISSKEAVYRSEEMTSIDGLFCDQRNDHIYIADYASNAIRVYLPEEDELKTLWENGDTNGKNGLLDSPCEVRIRDNKLIVVNFDMPFPGVKNTKYDEYHTLSVIDLEK